VTVKRYLVPFDTKGTGYRSWAAPVLLAALGVLLVWDRRLPYRSIDAQHEGQFLSWANAAMHGRRPGLEIKTIYGYLQTEALAGTLRVCGATAIVWRRYAFALKLLSVILFAISLWLVHPSPLLASATLLAGLAASPTWFDPIAMQYLRVVLPLVVLCWTWSRGTPSPDRLAVAGIFAALAFWWSPDFGAAGIAAMVAALVAAGSAGAAKPYALGAAGVLLLPLAWAGARYPEFVGAHLAFSVNRLTGYGWTSLSRDPGWWLDLAAGPALLAVAWPGRRRDPLLVALALFAIACTLPTLTRADPDHQELAHPAILAALARALVPLNRPKFRRVVAAAFLVVLAAGKAVHVWDYHLLLLPDRWSVEPQQAEIRAGLRRESHVPRLAGLALPAPECAHFERLTDLLMCATQPDEPIFLMANEQILYFLADRLPATAYPLYFVRATPLQSALLLTELQSAQPRYLLIASNAGPDGPDRARFPAIYAWAETSFAPIAHLPPSPFQPAVTYDLREDAAHARLGVGRARLATCKGYNQVETEAGGHHAI